MRRALPVLMALALVGCSAPPWQDERSAPAPAPAPTHRHVSPASPAPTPSSAPSPAPSVPAGWKALRYDPLVLHVPPTWDLDAFGDTAWVGVLAGGPQDLPLRVYRNFGASIEALKPTHCPREGDPPAAVLEVRELERGLRPVAGRQAEYRRWEVRCPGGVTRHRAWVLPRTGVGLYEQVHAAELDDVLRTLEVRP